MPIYEYACKSCDHRLDALQKMSDPALVDCPECGEPTLKKLLSAPKFRLKGKGWYETDFKKDNQRNLSKSDSDDSKSSGSGGKSDSGKDVKKSESSSAASGAKKETSSSG